MHTVHVAAHELCLDNQSQIVHANGTPFDANAYSRMKHGDRAATQGFALELAETIVTGNPDVVFGDTPPEFLVAYKAVPPACYYLSRYCLDSLNLRRVEAGQEPGRMVQIYKGAVIATNYATASTEDRQRELQSIDFTLEGRSIQDKPVVVLDDVRITGGAEQRVLEVIAPAKPAVTLLGYAAIFHAEQAAEFPSVENTLNTAVVRRINDLLPTIQRNNFDLNIRTLKLLLATPEDDLRIFLEQVPDSLIEGVLRGTVDTGPNFIKNYRNGYTLLTQIAHDRGL